MASYLVNCGAPSNLLLYSCGITPALNTMSCNCSHHGCVSEKLCAAGPHAIAMCQPGTHRMTLATISPVIESALASAGRGGTCDGGAPAFTGQDVCHVWFIHGITGAATRDVSMDLTTAGLCPSAECQPEMSASLVMRFLHRRCHQGGILGILRAAGPHAVAERQPGAGRPDGDADDRGHAAVQAHLPGQGRPKAVVKVQ